MQSRRSSPTAVLVFTAVLSACESGQSGDAPAEPTSQQREPSIVVTTARIRKQAMAEVWTLYGNVSALSSSIRTYTLPFEVRVERVHVSPGQHVAANAPLFDSRRSPASAVAAETATDLEKEAAQRLEQVTAREADELATRDELIRAQGQLRRAQQQVEAMRQAGQLTQTHTTRSLRPGVVSTVAIQAGAMIPAGAPTVGIAEDATIGVELWADPAKARALAANLAVDIEGLGTDRPVSCHGRILRVDERVDSMTRLVRVSVALDDPGALLLGQAVRARVSVEKKEGFIVPRASLVTEGGHSRVYTVKEGRARAHDVTVIVDSGDELLVRGIKLDAQQQVITQGAYQTEDGMRVETRP